jgi:hypothetical protein
MPSFVIAASTASVRALAFDRALVAVADVLRTSIEIVATLGGISTAPFPVIESVDGTGGAAAGVAGGDPIDDAGAATGWEKADAVGAPAAQTAASEASTQGAIERRRVGWRGRWLMVPQTRD